MLDTVHFIACSTSLMLHNSFPPHIKEWERIRHHAYPEPIASPTGGQVLKTFWEGGQPSRHGNCVHMEKFGDRYLWANEDCSDREAFACQIPLDTTKQAKSRYSGLPYITMAKWTMNHSLTPAGGGGGGRGALYQMFGRGVQHTMKKMEVLQK